jgi:zinc protease
MRDYYARHYHTANATLVLCGDFDRARALELVTQHFGSFEGGPVPERPDPQATLSEPTGERRLTMTWDDHARRLCMAWPTVRVGTDDDFRLDLVATLLTGGRLARLYRRLVLERGIATSISTHNDTHVDTGVFWLYAEAASGVTLADLERAVDAEIAELAAGPVSAPELTRAKRILRASEAHENETVTDLAEELGEFAVDAHWHLALDTIERVEAVRAAEVRDVVTRYLTSARRVVGWCVPRDEPEPGAAARRTPPPRKKGKTRRKTVGKGGARKKAARSGTSGARKPGASSTR